MRLTLRTKATGRTTGPEFFLFLRGNLAKRFWDGRSTIGPVAEIEVGDRTIDTYCNGRRNGAALGIPGFCAADNFHQHQPRPSHRFARSTCLWAQSFHTCRPSIYRQGSHRRRPRQASAPGCRWHIFLGSRSRCPTQFDASSATDGLLPPCPRRACQALWRDTLVQACPTG